MDGVDLLAEVILRDIDAIDWRSIPEGYSTAVEVRQLLRELISSGPGSERERIFDDLWQDLIHQGTVSPVTAVALPFLVAIARQIDEPFRDRLLSLIATCAHPWTRFTPAEIVEAGLDDPARQAVRDLLPTIAEIGDESADRRMWVAVCLGQFPERASDHLVRLRRWHDEAMKGGEAVVHALALVCLGEATPDLTYEIKQQHLRAGKDFTAGDDEMLDLLLSGGTRTSEDVLGAGELLCDAAVFVTNDAR